MELTKKEKSVQYAVWIVGFCGALWMVTSTCLGYIINSYPGLPITQVQQLLTLPSVVGIATSLLVGPLSMKISKKVLVTASLSCLLTSSVIFALVGGNNFNLLIVGCIVYGLHQGMGPVLMNSIIAALIPPAARANTSAKYSICAQVGGICYNVIGGWIASGNNGANWPKAFYLGLVILPVIILFNIVCPSMKPEKKNTQTTEIGNETAQTKDTFPLYAVFILLSNLLYVTFFYGFSLFISDYFINVRQIGDGVQCGYVTSSMTVGVVVTGLFYKYVGKIVKNWSPIVGCCLIACGFVVIACTGSVVTCMIGAFLIGMASLFINPFVTARLSMVVTGKYVTIAMSAYVLCTNVAIYISPFLINGLAGLFASADKPLEYMQARFLSAAAGIIIVAVIMAFIFPIYMKKHEEVV